MIRALAAAGCLLLLAAAPAEAGSRVLAYRITDASMQEELDFQGDGGPACARAGVCGFSGTVTYGFDGIEAGDMQLVLTRRGDRARASGFGELFMEGITKATVTGPGGGPPCTEQILRRSDAFEIGGTPGRVRVSFHSPLDAPNFLDTFCVGPRDDDVWHAGALPRLSVPGGRLRRRHLTLDVSTRRPFHSGPFTGTLSFSTSIRLHRVRLPRALRKLLVSLPGLV